MSAELSRLMGMMDMAKAQRKISGKVRERIQSRLCLTCDKEAVKRGVCLTCYSRFYARFVRMGSASKSMAYEEKCIQAGLILAVGQAHKLKATHPFAKVS